MKPRRTLTSALTLPADTLAFIHGGPPGSPTAITKSVTTAEATSVPATADPDAETIRADMKTRRARPLRPPATSQNADPGNRRLPLLGAMRVPLTTRLQPGTAHALRRAHLEQRLNGLLPATQQEIVEAAVYEWLRQHGYFGAE